MEEHLAVVYVGKRRSFTANERKLYNYCSSWLPAWMSSDTGVMPGVIKTAAECMKINIEEVTEGTYRLQANLPGAEEVFSAYLIKENGGVLIEPGPATLIPTIQQALNHLGLSRVEYIIPTHIHLDHAGAIGGLAQLFPQAKVVVNRNGAKHVINPSKLIQSTRMIFGVDYETVYGAILPVPESQVKIARDMEGLLVDGRELVIINTPGHAPHHIAVFDTRVKSLFCGEALGLIYSLGTEPLPAAPPPSFDIETYLRSMEKLRQLKSRLLLYSHGGIGNDPEVLISKAAENTRVVGDAVLHALKTEKTDEAVASSVDSYIRSHYGVKLGEFELASNVGGFTGYFRKRGLI